MSWLPIYNAFGVFLFIVSVFLWNLEGLKIFCGIALISIIFLWIESLDINLRYLDSFWMFILSEVMIFVSLITSCLWFNEIDSECLSDHLDIPFMGCFVLIGSSITATAYHHYSNDSSNIVSFYLFFTILLGLSFVYLQFEEFSECLYFIDSSAYYASCFCTVGLHFTHVVIGIILLLVLLLFFSKSVLSTYYCNLVIWYWHFVDYVWLAVYTVVYLC
uniref:Cytochrome c oxidase subunit 3 n=1 Tax=Thaparocleidus varicus TaxID=341076 RepID=A0A7L8ZRP9_9PLAT|nr:cytochrome c oxidase subunit III [Thaparocleidus varicus]QOI72760.1 cytochrome c oxidase subunit 3 [Thaparocleidus varicus]